MFEEKKQLSNTIVIENVIQSKMRGKVVYQSSVAATDAIKMTFIKPYNDPSEKGYQRPVSKKRCIDFSIYLSKGNEALFTPILINAGGNGISHHMINQELHLDVSYARKKVP
nr:hypothetical protein [Bacillus amyloliquefaciens]MDH3090631.1 hypothetical protein [Bacillus amyloliquefaciens]